MTVPNENEGLRVGPALGAVSLGEVLPVLCPLCGKGFC